MDSFRIKLILITCFLFNFFLWDFEHLVSISNFHNSRLLISSLRPFYGVTWQRPNITKILCIKNMYIYIYMQEKKSNKLY